MTPNRRTVIGGLLGVLALAGALLLCGCLVIPVNYYAMGSRQNVRHETAESLRPGVTSRDEVFLMLGEPDLVSEDGLRLGYAWTKVRAIWFVATTSGSGGGEILRSHLLQVRFDTNDLVTEIQVLNEWGPAVVGSPTLDPAR